ncbi:MAG TPA: hypothetical protein DEQ34_11320 [Balneolaceae bacterium]|nr:hypothetical protein [Balneolaceae bacterium]|tara:strand:- start:118878 stop:120608 length:1731 start_codon:yes stop_codon:yes gene_type:complete
MKKLSLTITFLLLTIAGFSQSFQSGLTLYEQGDYERALQIFQKINTPEATLFAGKSLLALDRPIQATKALTSISASDPVDILHEAIYTNAIASFRLGDYSNALDLLFELSNSKPITSASMSAMPLYDKVITFLTIDERRAVFNQTNFDQVRYDIIESAIGQVNYQSAIALVELLKEVAGDYDPNRINEFENRLSDPVSYNQNYTPNIVRLAPDGLSYNIGVVLPEFDISTPEYDIPQNLYLGIQLAVEEFNSTNSKSKAFIHYNPTNQSKSSEAIVSELVWKENVDVILGPLFSDKAKEFSNLAESYHVPMILPLANADSLDLYNDYVFQINPTFEAQGTKMAQYAINTLGYDTLAVLAEQGSLGAPAARAFRHEVQRLGGFIQYYFEEDLEENGYDIVDFTQYFTTDPEDSVVMVDAVYAPFTGSIAQTLIESMLTDLEAMRSSVDIFGSEEWKSVDLESRRLKDSNLYYTESFNVDTSLSRTRNFISNFRVRFGTTPNEFAFIGYDVANITLNTLRNVKNPALLRDALKDINNFYGLSVPVRFNKTHVNQSVIIKKMNRSTEADNQFIRDNRRR